MSRKDMPPGPGRPKGVPNKITTEVKQMVLNALESAGGEDYLLKQAKVNPNAFLTLLGKIIPSELHAKLSGAIAVNANVKFIKPGN
jgi:hypothetical protein